MNDYLPQGSTELFVCHLLVVFLLAPEIGDDFRVDDTEDTLLAVLPLDDAVLAHPLAVLEKVSNELPQMVALVCCDREE